MPYLLFSLEKGTEKRLKIERGKPFTFGRSPECDLSLPDPSISKFHAYIDAEFFIRDGSTSGESSLNGTFLNMKKVVIAPLEEGDCIQIGGFSIIVQINDTKSCLTLSDKIEIAHLHLAKTRKRGPAIAFDEAGITLYVNDAAEAFLEISKEKLLKQSIYLLFPGDSPVYELLKVAAYYDERYPSERDLEAESELVNVYAASEHTTCQMAVNREYIPQIGPVFLTFLEPALSQPENDSTRSSNPHLVGWAAVAMDALEVVQEMPLAKFTILTVAAILVGLGIAYIRNQ